MKAVRPNFKYSLLMMLAALIWGVSFVFQKTGIVLTGVSVYSFNTHDDEAARMRNAIRKVVLAHDWAIQMHGFYVDDEAKSIRFDVVLSFDIDRKEALDTLYAEVAPLYPDYEVFITPDVDLTD